MASCPLRIWSSLTIPRPHLFRFLSQKCAAWVVQHDTAVIIDEGCTPPARVLLRYRVGCMDVRSETRLATWCVLYARQCAGRAPLPASATFPTGVGSAELFPCSPLKVPRSVPLHRSSRLSSCAGFIAGADAPRAAIRPSRSSSFAATCLLAGAFSRRTNAEKEAHWSRLSLSFVQHLPCALARTFRMCRPSPSGRLFLPPFLACVLLIAMAHYCPLIIAHRRAYGERQLIGR